MNKTTAVARGVLIDFACFVDYIGLWMLCVTVDSTDPSAYHATDSRLNLKP